MSIKCAAVGVDLGTTNSTIAYLRNNRIHVPELLKGKQTIPSVVTSTQKGLKVWTELDFYNGKLIYETKRIIGKQYDEIKNEFIKFDYPLIKNESNGQIQIHCTEFNRFVTPEEVSSTILRYMYGIVEGQTNELIDKAVITIPNHFNKSQKLATIKASKMAGVHNVALIQEPVAAALSYGIGLDMGSETVLVLDIGGGTYDISIIEVFEKIIEVVATSGDQDLGGRNFDYVIYNWMVSECGINTEELNKFEIEKMYRIAEKAKIEVIENGKAIINLKGHELILTIDIFNKLSESMVMKFLKPIKTIGSEACITWHNATINNNTITNNNNKYAPPPRKITKIVLAGLSCKIPVLIEKLKLLTGIKEVNYEEVDPKLCVAIGACMYAGMMEGNFNDIEIMDGSYVSTSHHRISGFQSN